MVSKVIHLLMHIYIRYFSPVNIEPSPMAQLDLRTGGCWFDPWLCQYSFRGLTIVIATGFIPLSMKSNDYVGKLPVAWKEYCAEHWLKQINQPVYMNYIHGQSTELALLSMIFALLRCCRKHLHEPMLTITTWTYHFG